MRLDVMDVAQGSLAPRLGCTAAALLVLAGCGPGAEDVSRARQAVVFEADDRLEPYELRQALREALLGASAALVFAHRLSMSDPDSVVLRAETSGTVLNLCPGERFGDQPYAAYCSGVLIDDDLIATAGHCLGGDKASALRRCAQTNVVFGYAQAAEGAGVALQRVRR